AFNPELSPAVDAVIMRGLAKDPKMRWPSCGEMVAALESALATRAPRAAAAAPSQTLVMAPPMPDAPTIAVPPPPAPPTPTASSLAPPPADLPDIRYVPGRAAKVRGRSRRFPRFLIWVGALLAIVIVLGTAGALVYAALQPAVTLSQATAHPGDQVLVTA